MLILGLGSAGINKSCRKLATLEIVHVYGILANKFCLSEMVEGAAKVLEAVSLIAAAVVAFILNAVTVAVFYNRPALRSPSNR